MKKHIIFLLIIISGFFSACSTSPYLKETELPKNIKYYSADKQFKVKPEWYWRLRPEIQSVNQNEAVIGFKYLAGKSDEGLIIGETIQDKEIFFIVNWENYGYFFIRKEDYNFAEKFKKWLIPLHYNISNNQKNNSFYSELQKNSNVSQKLSTFFSSLNGRSFTLTYAFIFLQSESFNKYAYTTPGIKQYCNAGHCSNTFIQITGTCPLFMEFCSNKDIYYPRAQFATLYAKDFEYPDNYGQVFIGKMNAVVYIILQWGEVYYALPYEPFNKLDGIEFNAN